MLIIHPYLNKQTLYKVEKCDFHKIKMAFCYITDAEGVRIDKSGSDIAGKFLLHLTLAQASLHNLTIN